MACRCSWINWSDALRLGCSAGAHLAATVQQHGPDLQRHGCTVAHLVYHYGDVYQAITKLAGPACGARAGQAEVDERWER
jgi:hypothetical protein